MTEERVPNPEDLFSKHSMGGIRNTQKLVDNIWYLFWRKGVGYEEFKNTPLPYIMTIVNKESERLKEEDKQAKKAGRKR